MDISLAGEGYANFGVAGGCAFMFLVSLFYNWVIIRIISISKNHPTLILFIPFLFFQVMKAETDFSTVINYLTKAALVCWLVFYAHKIILTFLEKKKKISLLPDDPVIDSQ
jgi:large-conductance mechanosensitive channel